MTVIDDIFQNNFLFGTFEDDSITATEGDDFVVAGFGNDVISGGSGIDFLYGEDGNDSAFGGADGDYIYGARGNDFISGEDGDDFLIGVDVLSPDAGAGEIDILTGGTGSDVFYLADIGIFHQQSFYDSFGNSDFAVISDFNPFNDFILVNAQDNIVLADFTLDNFGFGTAILVNNFPNQNELIGFVQGVSENSLVFDRFGINGNIISL